MGTKLSGHGSKTLQTRTSLEASLGVRAGQFTKLGSGVATPERNIYTMGPVIRSFLAVGPRSIT